MHVYNPFTLCCSLTPEVVERHKTTDVIDDESFEPTDPLDNTFLGETSSPNSDNDHTWEELPQCSDEALVCVCV